ncbi:predicted protein, partial [Postia placenta Mad-698-R]
FPSGLFILDLDMAPWGCGVWPAWWTLGGGQWPYETNGVPNLDCDGELNYNSGCGVVEWSRASYGPIFDSQGGGIFAMKWDVSGIGVCACLR